MKPLIKNEFIQIVKLEHVYSKYEINNWLLGYIHVNIINFEKSIICDENFMAFCTECQSRDRIEWANALRVNNLNKI
jgi:hypothetical protein